MKRLLVLLMLGLTVLGSASSGRSAVYRGGDMVHIAEGDTIRGNLFASARYVDIDGVVTGNVYVMCEVARINGEVHGTVHAFSRRLEIRGSIENQVLFFGETMILDGLVQGDVLAFGRTVEVTRRGKVDGNLLLGCREFMMSGGHIRGALQGGVGRAQLNGVIDQPLTLKLKKVYFGEQFQAPAVNLTMEHELDRSSAGAVPENLTVTITKPRRFYRRIYFYWSVGAMIVVGLLWVALGKHFLQDMLSLGRQRPLLSLGSGFLSLVATPVAAVLLLALILTIPIGVILLVVYCILLYLSYVLSSIFLGQLVLRWFRGNGSTAGLTLSVVIGVVLLSLMEQLPKVGGLIELVAWCLGFGMLVLYIRQNYRSVPVEQ